MRPRMSIIVAGVMSGTSADGINVALVRFQSATAGRAKRPLRHGDNAHSDFELLAHAEYPFPAPVRRAILAAMNAELDTTDHPFGAVVKPLGFHRHTLSAVVLMSPSDRSPPDAVIRHKAVLETPDGAPFSLVIETYTKDVLAEGP